DGDDDEVDVGMSRELGGVGAGDRDAVLLGRELAARGAARAGRAQLETGQRADRGHVRRTGPAALGGQADDAHTERLHAVFSFSMPFCSLPVGVRGSSVRNSHTRGILKPAILSRRNVMSSASSSGPGVAPAPGMTNALTLSPISGSGMPMTATS